MRSNFLLWLNSRAKKIWDRFKQTFHREAAVSPESELLLLGRQGEREAYRYLRKCGFKVVARNFATRSGEVDIVAWDHDILCFVEVKTRTSLEHGRPEEAVTAFKQRQILNTALDYLRQANLHSVNTRYDIVTVLYGDRRKVPRCRLIKRAFGGAAN